jgi:two-component system KDP operon response regulator KdpE
VAHAGKAVTHQELLHAVGADDGDGGNLQVYISQMRKKIEREPAKLRFIVTEAWVWYKFVVPK